MLLFMHFLKNLAGEDIYKIHWKDLIRIGNTLIILLTNSGALTINKIIGAGLTIMGWIFIEQVWKRKKVSRQC